MKLAEKAGKSSQKPKSGIRTPIKLVNKDVSEEKRYNMIREAAYLRAEQRNFDGGDAVEDWLNAESDINEQLGN